MVTPLGIMQKYLDKLWRVSESQGALRVLAAVSFTESIFFPLPPDLLLIPMALAKRKQAFRLAAICLFTSLLGGILGYGIGYFFMDVVGMPIIHFYGLDDKYLVIKEWYDTYSAWAVAAAGLTPIPYKLCTLTAGAFKIDFWVFIIASTISRGVRFFAIAGLIYMFGEQARYFLEKRFDLVLLATLILGIAGFVVIRYL
ncbi:VTT domain-containing protein [Desulfovibrio subterraneus]|uniref:VTT domain-containing protein n=1 Tax=Desulfovibrio subterraneus TaxID=2718620 RepID=A0A7J0BJB1_9BACT|nr:VTT domain-containing protein [Desulfovibrio subterraneus]WBF67992.1 VTT domain-containing protein [Desulfovibrio subterraneus]GFM33863.1 hypothetical protein DSM101010T_22280 [Desulfovibrio subterraneus]